MSSPVFGRLQNDLYCVGWGVKLYSLTPLFLGKPTHQKTGRTRLPLLLEDRFVAEKGSFIQLASQTRRSCNIHKHNLSSVYQFRNNTRTKRSPKNAFSPGPFSVTKGRRLKTVSDSAGSITILAKQASPAALPPLTPRTFNNSPKNSTQAAPKGHKFVKLSRDRSLKNQPPNRQNQQ